MSENSILIVDDEFLVLWMLEDVLRELGYERIVTAGDATSGLAALRSHRIYFAILDINLDGDTSFGIAEELEAQGIPFAFLTGYGRRGLKGRFENSAVLDKPVDPDLLKRTLENTAP